MHPTINIAIRAARSAGNLLVRYFDRVDTLKIDTKGMNDFVTEVDRAAEQVIIEVLRKTYPSHGILAEESGNQPGESDYQWIIDPLDGTTNYLHGFPQFSISIALRNKDVLEQALVYDPLREEMFTASRGGGAQLNDRRIRVSSRKSLDGALLGTGFPYRERAHLDAYLGMLKVLISETAGIRRPGSAALDLAYVASGRVDGFWEIGLSQWDIAAGALLVKEAGGVVSDFNNGERYLESGNIIAGGIRVHKLMQQRITPYRNEHLRF
ncbi:MAG: inositol-1-monophosphatase [Gammaproteobacteria bacterium]|nr:inositol-1-monophosphatase [Gammaproteobacteria bacterium]MCP5416737.1 inositol-1-monophosphatase [Chromatiaceae bacterium]